MQLGIVDVVNPVHGFGSAAAVGNAVGVKAVSDNATGAGEGIGEVKVWSTKPMPFGAPGLRREAP